MDRKINIPSPTTFAHHRDGWKSATIALNQLHSSSGIRFFDWADRVFKDKKVITEKWCGILHNALKYPAEYPNKYRNRIYPLTELVRQPFFTESLKNCLGIYTLSRHTTSFLQRHIDPPVYNLLHPARNDLPYFLPDLYRKSEKILVAIGQWMRKYHSIYNLKTNRYKKTILGISYFNEDYDELKNYTNSFESVEMMPFLNNTEYDQLLQRCIVFLDFYDVAACNSIIECIMRNTPVITRLMPGTVEYLGANYPLFFETLEEAEEKLHDDTLIIQAHEYLLNMDKTQFSPQHFCDQIVMSSIYQKLPMIKM